MLVHCRAPLPPDSRLFDKYHGKKASDYDVSSCNKCSVMIKFTHVVGYLSWKDGMSHHHGCVDFIQPFRQQLPESETAFCGICHKNCTSVVDFILHHEQVYLCLPLFVCAGLLLYLCYLILFTNAHH